VPYLAMEYVQGRTLKEVLAHGGALSELRVLHIMRQVCGGLHEAHGRGIVHRDLKPENIMVLERHGDADFVKLLDFGIAKVAGESEARLTQSGMVFGTPHYMAPEQIRGEPVDQRTDVYALGLIMYELLSGQPAVAGDSTFEVLTKQVNETPPRLAARGIRTSSASEAAMFRCLEKEPCDRWPSVAQLRQALGPASPGALAARDQVANDGRTVSLPSEHSVSVSGPRPKLDTARRRRRSRRAQRAGDESWSDDSTEHLNYYELLPLPRFLKPYAPWIVSITSVLLMAVFSIVMQQCSYRRLGHLLRRVDHATSSE
jgi:serine/threonine protein kinase